MRGLHPFTPSADFASLEEIRQGYFRECEELLEALTDALGDPAFGAPGSDAVNIAFRAVHSIKGGAASFGMATLTDVAHQLETSLDAARSGQTAITSDMLHALLRATDQLSLLIEATRHGHDAAAHAHPPKPTPPADTANWLITFQPNSALFASGNEPLHILNALSELGDAKINCDTRALPDLATLHPEEGYLIFEVTLAGTVAESDIRECFEFVEDVCALTISRVPLTGVQQATSLPPPATPRAQTEKPEGASMRVDLARIDRLMNLVGELVIGQSMLEQGLAAQLSDRHSPVKAALDALCNLTSDLQEAVMEIRAQPLKPLFQRMGRILRETSAATGKPAELILSGEATEVDRTIIEQLTDPLTHMIRNAIDHGLEDPAMRRATGKPAAGRIRLSAEHRAGRVIVELSDDGAGINRDRVREIAQRRGLIAGDKSLSDAETDELLFAPGFSTATAVTTLSGRGVGLDVVRAALSRLGGRVSIQSTPGVGTQFTISLPLTLAVMEGMAFRAADQTLILPLAAVVETMALGPATAFHYLSGRAMLPLRGQLVATCNVADALGFAQSSSPRSPTGVAAFVTDEDGRQAALIFDDIEDLRQVVIKGLRDNCGPVPGIAAATILGDGRVALILDPGEVIEMAEQVALERLSA